MGTLLNDYYPFYSLLSTLLRDAAASPALPTRPLGKGRSLPYSLTVRLNPSLQAVAYAVSNTAVVIIVIRNVRNKFDLLNARVNQNPLPKRQGREDWRSNKPFPPPFHESMVELVGAGGLTDQLSFISTQLSVFF